MSYRFTEACDGCSACATQCPVDAIEGTPDVRYDVNAALCVDCGVCGMVCPVDAVLDEHGRLAKRIPRDQRPRPHIDTLLCNGCALCVVACPWDCKQIVGPIYFGVAVLSHAQRCTACAECEKICPRDAVRMRPLDPRTYDADGARTRAEQIVEMTGISTLTPTPALPERDG